MNHEIYNEFCTQLTEAAEKYRTDDMSFVEYTNIKKALCCTYIDYKEEFIAALRDTRICIADNIVFAPCVGLRCGYCYEGIYNKIATNINHIVPHKSE